MELIGRRQGAKRDKWGLGLPVAAGGGGGGALPFSRANIITATAEAGRTSVNTLKIPGVDPMPAGASYSAGLITVTGDDVLFEDWKINRITGAGARGIIRQCEIEDTGDGSAAYPVTHTGTGWILERSKLYGQGDPRGSAGLVVSSAPNFTMRYNYLVDYSNDGLKLAGPGTVIEYNRFGQAQNTLGVSAYSAAVYYPPGSLVSSGGVWEKLTTAPAGTTPASGVNWVNLDPHVDQITAYAGSGIIRYNHFETQSAQDGLTQRIRVTRNTGTNFDIAPWQVYGNVMEAWLGAYPLSSGVVRAWRARSYAIGELCANATERVFYRATAVTSDNPEVSMTNWTLDRDLNVDGEVIWAHNFVENGTSGVFNAAVAPNAYANNSNAAGTIYPFYTDGPKPLVAAPALVGDVFAYTPPAFYGPASVFTFTSVVANGAAQMGGIAYNNVVAIRVGITLVALIDAAGYWYVNAHSGVTMEDMGGGSYKLRVFDTAGNLMDGSVSVCAGSATITVNADDASTGGPAWGTAPAILQTNNIPNTRAYNAISCLGQVKLVNNSVKTAENLSLTQLPLANGDYVVALSALTSNTNRNISIGTAGYTATNLIFANSTTSDANGAVGFKAMGVTPDTAVNVTTSAALASQTQIYAARGYRGVTSAARFTATGTGAVVNPPSVTATVANSIAVVIGVHGHTETPPLNLDASYATNADVINSIVGYGTVVLMAEVEIPIGVYDPPAMTFSGTPLAVNSWWAATILLTP